MRLNPDQRKHVAGVFDKVAIAYFAAVGYTAYSSGNWIMVAHAIVVFALLEYVPVWVLRDRGEKSDT